MKDFKEYTYKKLILVAIGILAGVILYQFINGLYTGIQLGLAE